MNTDIRNQKRKRKKQILISETEIKTGKINTGNRNRNGNRK